MYTALFVEAMGLAILYLRWLDKGDRLSLVGYAILGTLTEVLEPRGALVQLEATHTCMTLRGARKERSRLVTMSASGLFENDSGARREIIDLLATNVSSPTSR